MTYKGVEKMTLNELIFDSLEKPENIYIDYGKYIMPLAKKSYALLENCEVENWYLDIKDGKACIIVKVDF